MGRIKVLDDKTINQIKAGEVVENPASVVKELIENARDARATRIQVTTRGAGRISIEVSDNGEGMDRADLLLAVERHATSKIVHAADLMHIDSLGFRGEALASIAAIAKVAIHSSQGEGGYELTAWNGGIVPKPRRQGTTIEVRDLFYNTPVRRSFQKSIASDTGEIHKTLIKFALSNSHLALVWVHDDDMQFDLLPCTQLIERIAPLLGEEFAQELLPIGELGWIGRPTAHRPNRLGQYLSINGRPVTSPWIAHQVLEHYGHRLPARRFPLFVLSLKLPPAWVDVNVHPQKHEVRLKEHDRIAADLQREIARALEPRPAAVQAFAPPPPHAMTPSRPIPCTLYREEAPTLLPQPIRPLGCFKHYLLIQEEEELRFVDLHRALQRICFEKMAKQEYAAQLLLIPRPVDVTQEEFVFLVEQMPQLKEYGVVLRPFGRSTLLVEAIPAWMAVEHIEEFLHDLVQEGVEECCRIWKRVPSPSSYRIDEALEIFKQLKQCSCIDRTPDGKAITVIWTHEELDVAFRKA